MSEILDIARSKIVDPDDCKDNKTDSGECSQNLHLLIYQI
jgi:hypothetical protein